MTPIGRFSLKTETPTNPSVPTLFLALSGPATSSTSSTTSSTNSSSTSNPLTLSELSHQWTTVAQIPTKHARFHSRIRNQTHFEPLLPQRTHTTQDTMNTFLSETVPMTLYRRDLQHRIAAFLTTPLDVTNQLWECQLCTQTLGSSGAIPKSSLVQLYQDAMEAGTVFSSSNDKLLESILLFRFHHSIGDAVSLVSALGELFDEAQEIQDMIRTEIQKRKQKRQSMSWWRKWWRWIQTLVWFLGGSIQALLRHGYLIVTTRRNPFLQVVGCDTVEEARIVVGSGGNSGEMNMGRSISWCNVASVEEVKRIAKAIGPKVTINDVFVSCVSAAIVRQLQHHRKQVTSSRAMVVKGAAHDDDKEDTKDDSDEPESIPKLNVVIPAHLAGGILPPGREIGNLLGAFVAQVPGEMEHDQKDDTITSSCLATQRLLQVHSSLYAGKTSPAPLLGYLMARFTSQFLPESWAVYCFNKSNANAAVAVTNGRGYPKKVHMNGRRVETIQGFLPLPPGLPVGIVVGSYGNVISLSINAESWAVPDGDEFLGWVVDEYKLLCKEVALLSNQKQAQDREEMKDP